MNQANDGKLFDALRQIVDTLDPLTPSARARVLLFVALDSGIDIGEREFLRLVRVGLERREP